MNIGVLYQTFILVLILMLTGCVADKSGGSASLAGNNSSNLSAEEITALLAGNTVTWKHTSRDDSGKVYYGADGVTKRVKNGSNPYVGKWKADGSSLCFGKTDYSRCRKVERGSSGTNYFLVRDDGKRVIEITKIEQGDAI